ncbi:MAG TPA: hypothetical protein PLQ75_07665, partial [Anaerolineales bacterium]|nr:hypothetical protein [Anaerolineales bacterium]
MRRLFLPLLLTVLACGGNGIPGPTPTPLSPTATVSAPQTESQPPADPATLPPTAVMIESAQQFPDPTAYEWKP